jgi:lanosterol synthase
MGRRKVSAAVAPEKEPLLEKGTTRKRLSNAGDHDHATKRQRLEEKTDYSRWRMWDDHGRQSWRYLEDDDEAEKWPQTLADKYFLGLPLVSDSGLVCPFAITDLAH